ncbi:MAG: hypothetical protein ACI4NJ_12545 [Cellvibrio sp.]
MVETVSDENIEKLIACLGDAHNPAHEYEAQKTLARWLEDPLLRLTQAQRGRIEVSLSNIVRNESSSSEIEK